ncbi:MAG: hypothetical protein ACUVX9_09835 [Anaerolineae bacterium]
MAPETQDIRRDIAATRSQIDADLQQLTGRVQRTISVREQARRNTAAVFAAVAGAGLLLGFFMGKNRRPRSLRSAFAEEDAAP